MGNLKPKCTFCPFGNVCAYKDKACAEVDTYQYIFLDGVIMVISDQIKFQAPIECVPKNTVRCWMGLPEVKEMSHDYILKREDKNYE